MTIRTLGGVGKTNPKRTQTNPTYRGVASGEAGFQTAYLLIERTKSKFLNFLHKINLTVCPNSLEYWAFDGR